MFFWPRFAKKWDITWHDVSNKNDDFCGLEIGNLTWFTQEQWWVLLVWISQHWKFTPTLWPYSTDKAYYDKHNMTKRVGQQWGPQTTIFILYIYYILYIYICILYYIYIYIHYIIYIYIILYIYIPKIKYRLLYTVYIYIYKILPNFINPSLYRKEKNKKALYICRYLS